MAPLVSIHGFVYKKKKSSPWFTDPKTPTPEEELRREFPGITDDLIKNILADDNPQRIAEVKAAMKEAAAAFDFEQAAKIRDRIKELDVHASR